MSDGHVEFLREEWLRGDLMRENLRFVLCEYFLNGHLVYVETDTLDKRFLN